MLNYYLRTFPNKPSLKDAPFILLTPGKVLILSTSWEENSLAWCPLNLAPVYPAPAPKGTTNLLFTPQRRWVLGISQFQNDHLKWAPLPSR